MDSLVDKLIVTYKCEHAKVDKDGVVTCPYKQQNAKWLKNNLYISSKAIVPPCPKRLSGGLITCAKFELRKIRRKKK